MNLPCVMMAETAYRSWQPLLSEHAESVTFATVPEPEYAHVQGATLQLGQVSPEVIWLTTDALMHPLAPAFAERVANSPALRWVHSAGAGTDMPVIQAALARGVRVTTSHVNSVSIAEFVMRSVLDYFQQPHVLATARHERLLPRFEFREVHGTRWLILGLGAIGREVAVRARAFGAQVIGVNRSGRGADVVDRVLHPSDLAGEIDAADVVVIAVPASAETTGLVDAEFLSRMREDAVLVNVARAEIVDEAALLAALATGRPGFAILDVHGLESRHYGRGGQGPFEPDNPLWDHPCIALTPHASAGGLGRHRRGAELFARNLRKYLAGQPLPDEVSGRPA